MGLGMKTLETVKNWIMNLLFGFRYISWEPVQAFLVSFDNLPPLLGREWIAYLLGLHLAKVHLSVVGRLVSKLEDLGPEVFLEEIPHFCEKAQ